MHADLILYNARVYTVDAHRPWAQAVACAGGRIVAVGGDDEVRDLAGPDTRRIDCGGRAVLPGLIDAHVHLLDYAVKQQQVNLFGVRDVDEVRRRVRDGVAAAGPGKWVRGWGWDENPWDVQPTRALLDEVAPDTPVALTRVDMHTLWVNGAALRRAGVTAETPDPAEGRIDRDADREPTGILREWDAMALITAYVPDPDEADLLDWLRATIAEAHALGLTGIHDQRIEGEGPQSFRLLQALHRRGNLTLRVHANVAAAHLSHAAALGLQPGFGDERLWIGHVKAFADGSMGSRTALMLEPYEGEPDNRGVAVTPASELWDLAVRADEAGFPLSVHAIGDRAIRTVVDVLSEFGPKEAVTGGALPQRIEHVQILHPEDLPRLARHDIVASMQPVHLIGEWETSDRAWGQHRTRYAYALRSLLDAGTQVAFGSDAPVAPLDPMLGIYAAVTRQDPEGRPADGWHPQERISVHEAVRGYTLGPAALAGREHLQGAIAPGKWADMIVLSDNIFAIAPASIKETQVDLTVVDGEVVYER